MIVNWIKNPNNGQYFDLFRLDLDSAYFLGQQGIYVIWYASPTEARVIRVGQGVLSERLKSHRNDLQITQYSKYGTLKVTWAIIDPISMDGVEAFLFNFYKPLVGERAPAVQPIPINQI